MKTNLCATLMIGLLAATSSEAFEAPRSELGKGISLYDRDAGMKDECINFQDNEVVTEDVRLTSYQLTLVKSKEELTDKISFSASTQGSYGAFSAGAKSSFVRETEWNYNSNYILVRATRISKKQVMSQGSVLLKPRAMNVLRDSRFTFLESCGNAFATGIEMGGEVYGLIEIQASSYDEKQRIENSIRGSGAFAGGSASGKANFERTIRKLTTEYRAKVQFQHIGGGEVEVPNTVEGLLELSNRIETLSDVHPVPLNLLTRDYSTLSNYLMDGNDPEIEVRQNHIDWAEGKLELARNLYARILYILEYRRDFKRVDEEQLKNDLAYLDEKIIELKDFIARSYSFVNESDVSRLQLDLDVRLPKMKWRASRRDLRVGCEVKTSTLCGVASYAVRKSSACGVVGPLEGTGPVCGTVYKEEKTQHCGIKTYKLGRGAACGVELYRQCHYGRPRVPGGSRPRGRKPQCGVERYKECRDASFGVEEYNSCRHPLHEVEKYNTCRDKDFGYEFESCEHFTHGPAQYNACEVAEIGNQVTYCPKF